jgi:hypothetical protein
MRRIPLNHPSRLKVQEQLSISLAGFKGEQSLNYFYRYLPPNVRFIHNLRILHQEYYFQIDTLIITPKFFIVLEIKNYAGHLLFDDRFTQLTRFLNGEKESFDDPILQVNRQAFHLSEVMKLHKLPDIPIEELVVITNPSTYIECTTSYKEAHNKVIKSAGLKLKFDKYELKHQKEILFIKEMKKICKILNKMNESYNPDLYSLFTFNKENLLSGVLCPLCNFKMEYRLGKWLCLECNHISKTEMIMALKDYALLVSETITNKECKLFLNLPSTSVTSHLLSSCNLPYSGSRKSRKYQLNTLID